MNCTDSGSPDSEGALPPGELAEGERSEAVLRRTLEGKLRSLGPLNVHTVVARVDLANFLHSAGHWEAAQAEYDESLRWYRQLADADDPHLLVLEYTKAQALLRRGDLEGAKGVLLRICELNAASEKRCSSFTLLFLDCLAATLVRLGDWENARDVVMTVFALRRGGLSDGDTPATLSTASVLVTNYLNHDAWASALPLQEEVVAMLELNRGMSDVDTLLASSLLAVMMLEAGQPARARILLQSMTSRFADTFGRDKVETLRVFLLLAIVMEQEGDLVGACAILKRSFDIVRSTDQSDSDMQIRLGTKLASVLIRLGQPFEAQVVLAEVLPLCERVLGKDDATSLTNLNNLAVALWNAGQTESAYKITEEIFVRKLRKLGPDHDEVVESGKQLVSIKAKLRETGRLPFPEFSFEEDSDLLDSSLVFRMRAYHLPHWKQ